MSEQKTLKLSGEDLADWLELLDQQEDDEKLLQVILAFLPAIIFALRRVDLEEELKIELEEIEGL